MTQALSSFRDLISDEQVFLVRARVALLEGDTTHYFTNLEGDMVISCKTMRHSTPIYAIMHGGADDGTGTWSIPTLGTEVILGFDGGDFESDPFILSMHGTRWPAGFTPAQVAVVGDDIQARSVNGTAVALATKADAQRITDKLNDFISSKYNIHTHAGVSSGLSTTLVPTQTETTVANPDGTSVLKGE